MPNKIKTEVKAKGHEAGTAYRQHRQRFFVAAMQSPFKIGALLPSSRSLAKAMASRVDVTRPGVVIELGAGTGVVTQALLKAGVTPDKLLVIERDDHMHQVMVSHFPQLNVLKADAIELDKVLVEHGITHVNAIVSSLPFLAMPKEVRYAIQQQMATLIGEDGVLIQFTYGPTSPIGQAIRRKYHLQGKRVKLVVANVPPAHVWLYRRQHSGVKL